MDPRGELAPVVEGDHDLSCWLVRGKGVCMGSVVSSLVLSGGFVASVASVISKHAMCTTVRTGSSALALAMTCALVTTSPSSEMTKPEPYVGAGMLLYRNLCILLAWAFVENAACVS